MKTTAKIPPLFKVGDNIASDIYMGRVEGAAWFNDTWNYIIGENADIDSDRKGYHRIGSKYIVENNIKWKYDFHSVDWKKV